MYPLLQKHPVSTKPPAALAVGPLFEGHGTRRHVPVKKGLTREGNIGEVTPSNPALHEQPLTTSVPALLGTAEQTTAVHTPFQAKNVDENDKAPE